MNFSPALVNLATEVLDRARAKRLRLAVAESCTGGLICGLLTQIPGSSDVVDRGFVVYSNKSKSDLLGVPASLVGAQGAVSEDVAREMARGALSRANVDVALAVTGIAGPGGGTADKPVGLVHVALAASGGILQHEKHEFGDVGRSEVRAKAIEAALQLLLGFLG